MKLKRERKREEGEICSKEGGLLFVHCCINFHAVSFSRCVLRIFISCYTDCVLYLSKPPPLIASTAPGTGKEINKLRCKFMPCSCGSALLFSPTGMHSANDGCCLRNSLQVLSFFTAFRLFFYSDMTHNGFQTK